MLKNVLLSGFLATAFLGVFSTANAMIPEERELRGFVIKSLLKNKEYITEKEKIKITQVLIGCDDIDLFDIWNYRGRKDPEGPEYTFKHVYSRPAPQGYTGSGKIAVELVPEHTIFHFTATFEPLNP